MESGSARPLTLGTAGHIDHGKTALVEALTGVNTDRLAEERRRGLSIELGFAELVLRGGRSLGIVDVPGHERLIRTMAAGATGMDLFLLVIAADEGVMPQTREHLTVLEALGVRNGVAVLTKCDRAPVEARELAREEVSALLPRAPLVEVSAVTGEGLDELRAALGAVATEVEGERPHPEADGPFPPVLHVDRAFTLHGIGTVVTGTLRSGAVAPGDRVEVLPRGTEAAVRNVQVHGRDIERAVAGQRVALNLRGVRRGDVDRGDTIAALGSGIRPSYRLDVELAVPHGTPPIAGKRVQVHHGTRDTPGRVVDLGERLAQLRLEAPVMPLPGDRVLLRSIAPAGTIGGGLVLDPSPRRHGPGAATRRLQRIRERGIEAVLAEERQRAEREAVETKKRRAAHGLDEAGGPLDPVARVALAMLEADGAEPRSPRALAEVLRIDPEEAIAALERVVDAGRAVRVAREVYFASGALEESRSRVLDLLRGRGQITIAELRDALGTSRKYAQALLEYLDSTKVTVRQGDRHVLRARDSASPAGAR
ncbi:MAG TPA: selenocysteine-specific translation elongation factor [Solirubrobacterales bacterium]|nr:selenocysteine-specific translation elongation factor [Solirubrobacterales bacterium]